MGIAVISLLSFPSLCELFLQVELYRHTADLGGINIFA